MLNLLRTICQFALPLPQFVIILILDYIPMSRSFIVLGDNTNHGGQVITADYTFLIHGKPTARLGDLVMCPLCKGTFPIISGTPNMDSMGVAVAREGDKTACGATLIASQHTATWDNESSLGAAAAAAASDALAATPQIAAPVDSGICLDCLRKAASLGSATVIRE